MNLSLAPRSAAFSVVPLALLGLSGALGAQKVPEDTVQMVRCPNDGIQPRIAIGQDKVLHLIYFKGAIQAGDLFYVSSKDYARTFSEPVRVNHEEDIVDASGGVRGARLTLTRSGQLHVVWMGAEEVGVDPERRAIYHSHLGADGQFSPEVRIGGENHRIDSAPVIVEGKEELFLFWHEPAYRLETDVSVVAEDVVQAAAPLRMIYMVQSDDQGESFSEPRAVLGDGYAVSDRCSLGAGSQEDGTLYVAFQAQKENKRDWRILLTTNDGETFRSRFMDNWDIPRKISTTAAIVQGSKAMLVAYEAYGKVWFTRIDPEKHKPLMPYHARDTADWRGRPAVATNDLKIGVLVWIEGEKATLPERIVWQAFNLGQRTNIGMGREHELPEGTVPAIFVRPDQTFCILY